MHTPPPDDPQDDEGMVSVGVFSDPDAFDVGIAPIQDGAIVVHFPADPPQALAFVGQAREKFFAQVMEAGFLLGMHLRLEEEKLTWDKKATLH
jgi:hypothetical protein